MATEEEREKRQKDFWKAGAVVGGVLGLLVGFATPANQLPYGWIGSTVGMAILGAFIAALYEDFTQK